MTTMFYHSLASEDGHPIWEENLIETNIKMQGSYLSTPVNLIYKSSEMLFQKIAANILPSNYYGFFPISLLLTNYETLYNVNIVLISTHLLSQSLPFLQLQVCDLIVNVKSDPISPVPLHVYSR